VIDFGLSQNDKYPSTWTPPAGPKIVAEDIKERVAAWDDPTRAPSRCGWRPSVSSGSSAPVRRALHSKTRAPPGANYMAKKRSVDK